MTTTTTKLESAQNTKGKLSFPNRSHEVAYLKKSLGKKLFALALKTPSSTSKKDVTTAVKACKGRRAISQTAAVDAILRTSSLIYQGHCARSLQRYPRISRCFLPLPLFPQRTQLDHTGALAYRLRRYKAATARRTIAALMPDLSGEVIGHIEFALDFASVNFKASTSKGEQYGGRCTYHKTDGAWTATVQSNWNSHVAKRGLARVDGMLMLAAFPLLAALSLARRQPAYVPLMNAQKLKRSRLNASKRKLPQSLRLDNSTVMLQWS